jgi:hypothetical protein
MPSCGGFGSSLVSPLDDRPTLEGDDFAHGLLFLQSSSFTGSPLPLPTGVQNGSIKMPSCGGFDSSLVSRGRP